MYRMIGMLVSVAALATLSFGDASAQGQPKLVAKVYPNSVPQNVDKGQPVPWVHNSGVGSGTMYLTRDSVEKVAAFYAQSGLKVERIKLGFSNEPGMVGPWERDQALAGSVQSVSAAPVEYFRKPMDTGGYEERILGVAIVTLKPHPALQGDTEANRKTVLDDPVMQPVAIRPMAIYSAADNKAATESKRAAGFLQVDAGALIPMYNRHLPMLSGFLVKGVPEARLQELIRSRGMAAYNAGTGDQAENKASEDRQALNRELRQILRRKPDKQSAYLNIEMKKTDQMRAGNKNAQKEADAELDQLLLTDPELTAWKQKRDGLKQGTQQARGTRERSREDANAGLVTDKSQLEAVERYLSQLDKEFYPTMILIHPVGGQWATKDPATVQKRWNAWQNGVK